MQISERKYINLYVNIVVLDKIKISLDSNRINYTSKILYFTKDKEFYKHTLYRT